MRADWKAPSGLADPPISEDDDDEVVEEEEVEVGMEEEGVAVSEGLSGASLIRREMKGQSRSTRGESGKRRESGRVEQTYL